MKCLFIILSFVVTVSSVQAKKPVDCVKYQIALKKNQSQLRAGYREPKGNKLRAKRRKLSKQLRDCKRK